MILPIVIFGDPVLRTPCARLTKVTPEIEQLASDMLETMNNADGVGLAAPQVGTSIQLAVIDVTHAVDRQTYFRVDGVDAPLADHMPLVFINPVFTAGRAKDTDTEGCLSFPGVRSKITRAKEIKAQLTLLDGRVINFETDGLLARALQHEADHLHGRLFIDRMNAADKATLKRRLTQMYAEIEEDEREARRQARKK